MDPIIKRLHDERRNTWEQMKALLDETEAAKRDFTAEENEQWRTMNAELNAKDERIRDLVDVHQRNADAEAAMRELESRAPERRTDEGRGQPDLNEQLRAFLKGETQSRAFSVAVPSHDEMRALSTGTAASGGDTVPTSFYNQLVEHMIEVSGVLSAKPTVHTTSGGESFEVPITTSHGAAALVAEAGTIAGTDPAFAKRTLGAYKYGQLITVPSELISDTGVDLLPYLARAAGQAVGNQIGVDLVVGNGASKPSGVFQTSTLGVTGGTGVSGAFTADNLIDLYYSVIGPYRASSSCGWLMQDATTATARKLKDSNGQYLWTTALTAGSPDLILGKPIRTDPNVAAVALSAKSVAFGDFSAYWVRWAGGFRFERSDDFAFDTDQVTFRALRRGDGLLVDQTGAVKHFIGAGT